jgi:hypothetical protein
LYFVLPRVRPCTVMLRPAAVTRSPSGSGLTRTMLRSKVPSSIGLLSWIVNGAPGGQLPQPQRASSTWNGWYVCSSKRCSFSVRRGPSADGMPGGKTTSYDVPRASGACALKAIHRPACALSARRRTATSASISASVAARIGTRPPPPVSCTAARTASRSTA